MGDESRETRVAMKRVEVGIGLDAESEAGRKAVVDGLAQIGERFGFMATAQSDGAQAVNGSGGVGRVWALDTLHDCERLANLLLGIVVAAFFEQNVAEIVHGGER